jgi:hypothetical protein
MGAEIFNTSCSGGCVIGDTIDGPSPYDTGFPNFSAVVTPGLNTIGFFGWSYCQGISLNGGCVNYVAYGVEINGASAFYNFLVCDFSGTLPACPSSGPGINGWPAPFAEFTFTVGDQVGVPGSTAGAGLPGMAAAGIWLLFWRRWRQNKAEN